MSTVNREALEAERDFLLNSIRKLDNDRAAGVINETEYIDLRDEQTVRAAKALEQLDVVPSSPGAEGEPRTQEKTKARTASRITIARTKKLYYGVIGAFVVLAVVGVFLAATGRLAGQSSSGTFVADTNTLLTRAGTQTSSGKVADAVKTYDQVLKQDPQNVQALAYRGWLVRLAGLSAQGLTSINQAIAINPKYPDAHFFKGFILFRDQNNASGAVTEFNEFLADNPPSDLVPLVQQTLQDAQAESTTTTVPAK